VLNLHGSEEITWGGENRSISDDFGDETDTTFVPC
jgi:hypothetical protein